MTARSLPSALERFAEGDLGFAAVEQVLAEALHITPTSAPELLDNLNHALNRGLITAEAFKLLAEQVSRGTRSTAVRCSQELKGTILRHGETDAPGNRPEEATLVRGAAVTDLRRIAPHSTDESARDYAQAGAHDTLQRRAQGQPTGARSDRPEVGSAEFMSVGDEGTVIRGRYRLQSLLGAGGMGQVWKAKDLLLEQARDPRPHVAIKLLNSDLEMHPDAFVALQREAAKAQDLAHPNVATVYNFDLDQDSGKAFICMELLEGKTLDALILDHPSGLSPREAMRIIRQLAHGLAHAHSKGIVHCDFKPGNAFLTNDGVAKILDFGIARIAKDAARPDKNFDAGVLGALTPPYATVEMLRGEDPHSSDDVYALGLVAIELLTGSHPFDQRSAAEIAIERPRLPQLNGVNRREARAIQRAVAIERGNRWPDAKAFLKSIEGPHPLLLPALGLVVTILAVATVYTAYQYYLESMPQVPFEQLPPRIQTEFRVAMTLGDEAYAFAASASNKHEALQVLIGDALAQYAQAYAIHPKNRDAQAALRRSIAEAKNIAASAGDEERKRVRQILERMRLDHPVLSEYPPLQKAIGSLR